MEGLQLNYSKTILAFLLCFLLSSFSFRIVLAYSESFQIMSSLFPITRNIELNKGDQVTGELHLYYLPPKFSLSVWIEDSDGNRLLDVFMVVPHTDQGTPLTDERVGDFEFTASYSGIYRLKILYISTETSAIVNAKLTYDIKNSNPFGINITPETLYLIIGLIAVPIASYIIFKAIKH